MRIMTQQSYDAICDIVMEQKKRIEEKEQEITRLNNQIEFLMNLLKMKDQVVVEIHDDKKEDFIKAWNNIDFPGVCREDNI